MIIVKLMGWLGNQLFQYAAARRLAYVHNVPLKLDISGFEKDTVCKYRVHPFNIIENFANSDDLSTFASRKSVVKKTLNQLANAVRPYYMQPVVKQQYYHFDPNILRVGKDAYLDGYWQSEKYFEDVGFVLRKEITVRESPDSRNAELAREIGGRDSVSVHIRRGDYVSDLTINSFHGITPVSYYQRAVEVIASRISNPYLYIFTNDPEWVVGNIKFDRPMTILTHNDAVKSYEDLRLMSLCKHNIIANSTFSWWGAWLNQNPDKIVIAPRIWFKVGDINKDIVPESWLRL